SSLPAISCCSCASRSSCSRMRPKSQLLSSRLAPAYDRVGPSARRAASPAASAASSPSGTTRLMSPHSSAFVAGSRSPSIISSAARAMPTRVGMNSDEPPSGTRPLLTNASRKYAETAASRSAPNCAFHAFSACGRFSSIVAAAPLRVTFTVSSCVVESGISQSSYGVLMTRPVIGICAALERAQWSVWDQEAILLPRSYADAVQEAGGLAVMLPPDSRLTEEPDEVLERIDGLMLAGGADIDASSYGQEAEPETIGTVPERDRFEIALVLGEIDRDMLVLGICRGMQLINVALGGTLVQHLPDHYGHHEHRRVLGSFDGADHDVEVAPETLAMEVVGAPRHATKSHHHQGIDCLGAGLVVSGTSALDELSEAIELPSKRFVLGVQWHPEADTASPVVGALVEAARARARA